MLFYKESTLSFGFYSGFTRDEYHVIRVDFICSSRGRLERDRGFANPLSLSNTSPDPFGDPLRRGILAAAVYANIGFLYPVQVVTRQFRILFGCLCSGWYRSRFSRVVELVSHVFHYWGIDRSCLRLLVVLLWSIVGFALTAVGSIVLADTVMEYLLFRSLNRTNAFLQYGSTQPNWWNGLAPNKIGTIGAVSGN